MKWEDEGIVIYKKALQEKGALIGLLTREHGRSNGWMRGTSWPQLGECMHALWSSRTEEQLGTWKLEPTGKTTILHHPERLMALSSLCQLCQALPERHAYPELFNAVRAFLSADNNWRAAYIHFELVFLKETGFGLSLSSCAVTHQKNNLAFVSPKTGSAVTYNIGLPYQSQLLALPLFMTQTIWPQLTPEMYEDALKLTGYFIAKHVCHNRLPPLRQILAA